MSGSRKRRSVGTTLGGIIVGFDQQVFRTTRPIPELVESAKPIPPVPASDGGTIAIDLPAIPAAGVPADPTPTPVADQDGEGALD